MKKNFLSTVMVAAFAFCAPLQVASPAAPVAKTTVSSKPKRPAKKRVQKSWLSKQIAGAKLALKYTNRKARKNWANFAKNNPGKVKAIKLALLVAALTGGYLAYTKYNKKK
ncbi:MAG: hypothetical protein PVJ92_02960 [Candidatus Dependentiae bacterium]|jgi:hypothetical protein